MSRGIKAMKMYMQQALFEKSRTFGFAYKNHELYVSVASKPLWWGKTCISFLVKTQDCSYSWTIKCPTNELYTHEFYDTVMRMIDDMPLKIKTMDSVEKDV